MESGRPYTSDGTEPTGRMRLESSTLQNVEPYHIPGYRGYCPQIKFRIGNTFSHTTSQLFADKTVPSSGNLVLSKVVTPSPREHNPFVAPGQENHVKMIDNRKQSWGSQKLKSQMVPGYTGYIPFAQNQYGKRYAQCCVDSIADHMKDRQVTDTRREAIRNDIAVLKRHLPTTQKWTPKDFDHLKGSPYYMENSNDDKYFKSGYTGFVPRSRSLFGSTNVPTTHQALNNFTDSLKRNAERRGAPAEIHREPKISNRGNRIYKPDEGQIPMYTGYIPGQLFRFGQTYGNSTVGVLEKDNSHLNCDIRA